MRNKEIIWIHSSVHSNIPVHFESKTFFYYIRGGGGQEGEWRVNTMLLMRFEFSTSTVKDREFTK